MLQGSEAFIDKQMPYIYIISLDTLKSYKEYMDLYLKIKRELIDLGVPLDPNY